MILGYPHSRGLGLNPLFETKWLPIGIPPAPVGPVSQNLWDQATRLRDSRPCPLIGYMRVSKADGSQVLDLQHDALLSAGVAERNLYSDTASGKDDERPGLAACLQALREDDTLIVWKLDRLGRNLRHLVNLVHDLTSRGVGLKVLSGHGAAVDTTTPAGKLVFGIFASLAEFERELISEWLLIEIKVVLTSSAFWSTNSLLKVTAAA
jgi:hypothetical protein